MADNIIDVRIQNACKTKAEWQNYADVVLELGEIAITDFGTTANPRYRYKIGDGTSEWQQLPYLNTQTIFVEGTQSAGTTSGAWTGSCPQLPSSSALVDGQEITYWVPQPTTGNVTLNLTFGDGTSSGAVNCYYGGTTRLTTHYGQGQAVHLIYRKDVKIPSTGTTKYTGWWADADYNSNSDTKQTMVPDTSSLIYPTGTKSSTRSTAEAYYSTAVTIQGTTVTAPNFLIPSTGTIDDSAGNNVASKVPNLAYLFCHPGKVWTAICKGKTWSRLLRTLTDNDPHRVEGGLIHIANGDTASATFLYSSDKIVQLQGGASNKLPNVQIRLVTKDGLNGYVEVYDSNIESTATSQWRCALYEFGQNIESASSIMNPELYTSFIDGTTVPTGWAVDDTITLKNNFRPVTSADLGSAAFKSSGDFLPSTNKYAGSTAAGGMASVSHKTEKTLTLKINSGSAKTFNGSADTTFDVTTASLGLGNAALKSSSDFLNAQAANRGLALNQVAGDTTTYVGHVTSITASANIGGSAATTLAFGGTVQVPYFSVDEYGHTTASGIKQVKLPSSVSTWANNYYTTALNGGTTTNGYYLYTAGNNAAVKGTATIPAATTATYGVIKPTNTAGQFFDSKGSWRALTSADITSFSTAVAGVTVNNATNAAKTNGVAFGSAATVDSGEFKASSYTPTREEILSPIGNSCNYSGTYAVALGSKATAAKNYSFAHGGGVRTPNKTYSAAFGLYNAATGSQKIIFDIGSGSSDRRVSGLMVDDSGAVRVGDLAFTSKVSGAKYGTTACGMSSAVGILNQYAIVNSWPALQETTTAHMMTTVQDLVTTSMYALGVIAPVRENASTSNVHSYVRGIKDSFNMITTSFSGSVDGTGIVTDEVTVTFPTTIYKQPIAIIGSIGGQIGPSEKLNGKTVVFNVDPRLQLNASDPYTFPATGVTSAMIRYRVRGLDSGSKTFAGRILIMFD